MPSTRDVRARLQRALDERQLVRIERSLPFSDRDVGYVVAIGAKWFLTVSVVDGGHFNGYAAMRLRDLKKVVRDRSFAVNAWRLLNDAPPTAPAAPIELGSTTGLLVSAGANLAVFGIEKQRQRRAMWIGTLDEVHDGMLWMRELDTKARWSKRPRGYRLAKITSVSWGDRYMDALAMSASEPPASAPRLAFPDERA